MSGGGQERVSTGIYKASNRVQAVLMNKRWSYQILMYFASKNFPSKIKNNKW